MGGPDRVGGTDQTISSASTASAEARGPEVELVAGDVLGGRYELQARLGSGAFGVVFQARDRTAEDTVAVKVLSTARQSKEVIERFRRELRAARTVTHPGVVRVHDLLEVDGRLLLSMELVAGRTLEARLASGPPLVAGEWLALAADLAAGLAAAHEAGVTHRDLKPANVLLRRGSGRAVITDFGVSRLASSAPALSNDDAVASTLHGNVQLTREGAVVGTPLYMPPEQLRGASEVGPAADVYGLGVVLYEAATGKPPHTGRTVSELLVARASPPPRLETLRPDLPPAVTQLVDRCLLPSPDDRFSSAIALRDAVAAVTRPRGARRRLLYAAALAAVVAAGALAVTRWPVASRPAAAAPGPLRVAFVVDNRGGSADAWMAPAVARMVARRVRDTERRVLVGAEPAQAEVVMTVAYRTAAPGVSLEVEAVERGRPRRVASASAASVAEAIDAVLPGIATPAAGRDSRLPTVAESERMRRMGARSFDAYLLYCRAEDLMWGTVITDAEAIDKLLEEILRLDPGWAHAYALRALNSGGEQAAENARSARARVERGRDPLGERVLQAHEQLEGGDAAAAERLIDPLQRDNPDDLVAAWILERAWAWLEREDARIAPQRHLMELRPDLQFGINLADALRSAGLSGEIPGLLAAWAEQAPDNEQALAALAALAAQEGRIDRAQERAAAILLLHGEATHRLALLCDILIVAGRTREARELAERLLRGGSVSRARGQLRLAVVATLEGRFAQAYESLRAALELNRPLGIEGETTQVLEGLRRLAWVGEKGDLERWTADLAAVYDGFGGAAGAAIARFELALLLRKPGHCPDREAALASVKNEHLRARARVEMIRAAASAGCAACADVVKAGSSFREDTPSSFRLAACAEEVGDLARAERVFTDIARVRASSVEQGTLFAFDSVLATFHLARIRERQGRPSEARALYGQFLARWDAADRDVPEVEAARAALRRLSPHENGQPSLPARP